MPSLITILPSQPGWFGFLEVGWLLTTGGPRRTRARLIFREQLRIARREHAHQVSGVTIWRELDDPFLRPKTYVPTKYWLAARFWSGVRSATLKMKS